MDDADPLARAVDLFHTWRLDDAFDLLQELVDSPDRLAEMPALAKATTLRLYAEVARERDRLDLALPIAQPLAHHCFTVWGPRHPVTLRATVTYATILHDLGRIERAEVLYRMVLSGAGHRRRHTARAVLLARAHLALIAADRGDVTRAVEALTQSLEGFGREFGRFDPYTIRITRHLADVQARTGDPAEGRRLIMITHTAAMDTLGPRHVVTRLLGDDLIEFDADGPPPVDVDDDVPRLTGWRAKAVWRRRPVRTSAYIAGAAAIIALAVALGSVLADRPEPRPAIVTEAVPTATRVAPSPPEAVKVVATAQRLTVTWTDPSKGAATPVVTVVIDGQQSSQSLVPGTQRYAQRGYPKTVTACVTVSLLWPGADGPEAAEPVCAHA